MKFTGWVILGSIMMLQAVLIALFPKKMRKSAKKEDKAVLPATEQTIQEKNNINLNGNGTFIIEEIDVKPPTANGTDSFHKTIIVIIVIIITLIVIIIIDLEYNLNNFSDFWPALMKLLKNKLLMINIFSGVFYVLGGSGYITYMTKYMEVIFYKSAASANVIIGDYFLSFIRVCMFIQGHLTNTLNLML